MPLNVEIERDGETLKIWDRPDSFNIVSMMYTMAIKEQAPSEKLTLSSTKEETTFGELEDGKFIDFSWQPIYYLDIDCDLVRKGEQVLREAHTFGEFEFLPGDIMRAWRSHKS